MKFLFYFLTFFLVQSFAIKSPPSFEFKNSKAVFVDFINSKYSIYHNIDTKSSWVDSEIEFEVLEKGFPIFDLDSQITKIKIDGIEGAVELISSPDNETKYQVILSELEVGIHTMRLESLLTKGIKYFPDGVHSSFFTSDLTDRTYLEQYIPSSFEFDQYSKEVYIQITTSSQTLSKQVVFANGEVTEISPTSFFVKYPEHFNNSMPYFHLVRDNAFVTEKFELTSIDGRILPVQVYTTTKEALQLFVAKVKVIIPELELSYGPWLHNQIIVYGAGSGGMEYSGATTSSLGALRHELIHSYFARGLIPANGNSGWVDEAITSWRDGGQQSLSTFSYTDPGLVRKSLYNRVTQMNAYSIGKNFISFLTFTFGLDKIDLFLKNWIDTKKFQPYTMDDFQHEVESYFNADLKDYFKLLNKPREVEQNHNLLKIESENPFHPKLTKEYLDSIL